MCHFLFLIFSGQFRASGKSTPGPSEAEKLIGSGKKEIVITSRGMVFRADTKKKTLVGQAMFLLDCVYRRLSKTWIYGNQGLINNLKAESIWQDFIKNTSKFLKNCFKEIKNDSV